MRNPKASSHGDLNLVRALAIYDNKTKDDSVYLEDLSKGDSFFINGKISIIFIYNMKILTFVFWM